MSGLRILVTGATGLLGTRLVESLRQNNEVFALMRSQDLVPSGVRPILVDLSKPWTHEALPKEMDAIVHLAQSEGYKDFPSRSLEVFRVNVDSTASLLDYAVKSGVRKFIYASTGGIYQSGSNPVTEDSEILGPTALGNYFATKLSSEMLCASYRPIFEVNIARFFFIYGPSQREHMLIPRLARSIQENRAITLSGERGIRINPIYVDDASKIIEALVKESGPKTINIAGMEVIDIRKLSEMIGQIIGATPRFEIMPSAPDLVSDTSKLRALLGKNTVDLFTGLTDSLNVKYRSI
jgi:nucleoside-diphosphate-sugar epimerase